jgi:hypothetical protein
MKLFLSILVLAMSVEAGVSFGHEEYITTVVFLVGVAVAGVLLFVFTGERDQS